MNSPADIKKSHRRKGPVRPSKPCCGTLNYLSECRGTVARELPARQQRPSDGIMRIERRYPVAG